MNDAKSQKPLGTAREEVLNLLAHHGGTWSRGNQHWKWSNNAHWTEQLLCSLASRGLVEENTPGTYTITANGRRRVTGLPHRNRR